MNLKKVLSVCAVSVAAIALTAPAQAQGVSLLNIESTVTQTNVTFTGGDGGWLYVPDKANSAGGIDVSGSDDDGNPLFTDAKFTFGPLKARGQIDADGYQELWSGVQGQKGKFSIIEQSTGDVLLQGEFDSAWLGPVPGNGRGSLRFGARTGLVSSELDTHTGVEYTGGRFLENYLAGSTARTWGYFDLMLSNFTGVDPANPYNPDGSPKWNSNFGLKRTLDGNYVSAFKAQSLTGHFAAVPEPGVVAFSTIMSLGLVGMIVRGRRRKGSPVSAA